MSVGYRLEGDVALVTLERPERYNAIDAELSRSFVSSVRRAGDEARALVLTGTGKAFCSGADLSGFGDEYERGAPDLAHHLDEEFHPMVHALADCAVPVVGAINGVAAGAGMGLALGCDLRVMAASAYLTSAFSAIGLVPDSGSTWLLPRHLGVATALEMALTNRRMGADEALRRGVVAEVVGDDEVVARAMEIAAELADLPTDALVTARRLITRSPRLTIDQALEAEKTEQGRLGHSLEHREGVRAFLEKRQPDFRSPAP